MWEKSKQENKQTKKKKNENKKKNKETRKHWETSKATQTLNSISKHEHANTPKQAKSTLENRFQWLWAAKSRNSLYGH